MHAELIKSYLQIIPTTTVYCLGEYLYKMNYGRFGIEVGKFQNDHFGECYSLKITESGRPFLSKEAPEGTTEYDQIRALYISMQAKFHAHMKYYARMGH